MTRKRPDRHQNALFFNLFFFGGEGKWFKLELKLNALVFFLFFVNKFLKRGHILNFHSGRLKVTLIERCWRIQNDIYGLLFLPDQRWFFFFFPIIINFFDCFNVDNLTAFRLSMAKQSVKVMLITTNATNCLCFYECGKLPLGSYCDSLM